MNKTWAQANIRIAIQSAMVALAAYIAGLLFTDFPLAFWE
jgi:hypothetical protein